MRVREKYIRIAKRMEGIEPIPSDFPKYVEENIHHHLFYSRKEGSCYCTHCKSEVPYQPLRHKEAAVCPKCGTQATARSIGMSRSRDELNWFSLVQHFEDGLVVRHFRTLVNWQDFKNPVIETSEQYRNVITSKGCDDYMWWWKYQENEMAWIPYKKRGMSWYAYEGEYWHPYSSKCYTDLDEVIKGTIFKYSCLHGLMKDFGVVKGNGAIDCYGIEFALNSYNSAPYLEMLYKVGFHNLIRGLANYRYDRIKFNNAKDIYGVLGVDKVQYKLLLANGNPTMQEYRAMKLVNAHDVGDWEFGIQEVARGYSNALKCIADKLPISKAVRYMRKTGNDSSTYLDYLRKCERFNHDLNDPYYAYPSAKVIDLVQREEIARIARENAERAEREKVEREKKMRKNAGTLKLISAIRNGTDGNEAFHLHMGGLFVRIADSTEELVREGEILHHCVGRIYAPKMEVGETMIFLIRKESAPDEPFYTMEFVNGKVAQLRGMRNCDPTPEVTEFKAEFMRRVNAEDLAAA